MSAPLSSARPTPIREAFKSVGGAILAIGTVITALVTLGVLDAAQGTALEGLVALVPAVLEAVVVILVAFGVIKRAEKETTPLVDPRTSVFVDGVEVLVPLVPDEEYRPRF
ncbi:MAG TPA: hypothetical protein VIL55_02820 [Naasia sp.]|jgi:hypothetical protein